MCVNRIYSNRSVGVFVSTRGLICESCIKCVYEFADCSEMRVIYSFILLVFEGQLFNIYKL